MNAHNNIRSSQAPAGHRSDRLMAYLGPILIGAIGWIGDHRLRAEVATKNAASTEEDAGRVEFGAALNWQACASRYNTI